MKSIVMPKTVQLNEETKQQLQQEVQEIKETLAQPQPAETGSTFTAAEMWNRQRNSRSASAMMRWNLN